MTPPAQGHTASKCQPRCDSSSCSWSQPPGSTTHCPQSPKSRTTLGAPVGTGEDAHPEGPRPSFSYSGSTRTTILPLRGTFGSLQKYSVSHPGRGWGSLPAAGGENPGRPLYVRPHTVRPHRRDPRAPRASRTEAEKLCGPRPGRRTVGSASPLTEHTVPPPAAPAHLSADKRRRGRRGRDSLQGHVWGEKMEKAGMME